MKKLFVDIDNTLSSKSEAESYWDAKPNAPMIEKLNSLIPSNVSLININFKRGISLFNDIASFLVLLFFFIYKRPITIGNFSGILCKILYQPVRSRGIQQ